jgi:hypothetical protein
MMLRLAMLGWLEMKMRKKRFSDFVREDKKFELSFLESLGLPKAEKRICKFYGEDCVDPCSRFCGSYPFPVDPVDPDLAHTGFRRKYGEHVVVAVFEREHVIIPACVYSKMHHGCDDF